MALRGDFQGGSVGGAQPGLGLGGGGDAKGIAIEHYMKWNWAFFVGALLTFATSIGTMVYWLSHFTFAPATFFFEIFMLIFGLMMIVLDTPIPQMQKHPHIQATREQIYKFALFMTRFMGRGMWYLFLSTMVFGALWDTGINWFLGGACTAYLLILGIVAMMKGFLLTHKLNKVRDAIIGQGFPAERFIAPGMAGLSAQQFKHMVQETTRDQELFNDDEIDYIINALSFTPYHDSKVTLEEMQYWLLPGPPMMV